MASRFVTEGESDASAGGYLGHLVASDEAELKPECRYSRSPKTTTQASLYWDDSSNGHESPIYGEIWILATPIGVLVVAGESDDNQESADAAAALATQLLHTLEVAEN